MKKQRTHFSKTILMLSVLLAAFMMRAETGENDSNLTPALSFQQTTSVFDDFYYSGSYDSVLLNNGMDSETGFLLGGLDYYTIPFASLTFGEDIPMIPAGFFEPGSEPFTGTIMLQGANSQGGQLPQQDMAVNRLADLETPEPFPFSGEVPLELVELNLVGLNPISIFSGSDQTEWLVEVQLFEVGLAQGTASIVRDDVNGGSFDMEIFLIPVFIFRDIDNPDTQVIFNPMEFGFEGLRLFSAEPLPWMAPPIPNEFDPFGEQGMTLLTSSGNEFLLVPYLIRQDIATLIMDQEGQPEVWAGTGYNNSDWYYYPYTDWWNVWFYDHPMDVTRNKLVSGMIDIQSADASLQSYVEIIINWSTPEWPGWNGFPDLPQPPLPELMTSPEYENQVIERSEAIFLWEGNMYEPMTVDIPSDYLNNFTGLFNYNPEWISIDIRGYNFVLSAELTHVCFKPWIGGCEVICPDDFEMCANDQPINLMDSVSPQGGTFAGGNMFDPGTAPVNAPLQVNYTYTDPVSGESCSCFFYITVKPNPDIQCPTDFTMCSTDPILDLGTLVSPQGGTFGGGQMFDPSTKPNGVALQIKYTYTDPQTGCSASCIFYVTTYDSPTVTCPADFTMCSTDPILDLGTLVSPQGGTFGGGQMFDPSTKPNGVPLQIKYTYTDPQTGCSASCIFYITSYDSPTVTCPADFTMCSTDPILDLGTLVSPQGGTFGGGQMFDPSTKPNGVPLQIKYTYTDPQTGCSASCIFYITTYGSPTVNCPADMAVCADDLAFVLSGATPPNGSYSGGGVAGGMFDPAIAGVGLHVVFYDYTDPVTNCSNWCMFFIEVHPLPNVNCPADFSVCLNDPSIQLTGATPAGGIYSNANGTPIVNFKASNYGVGFHAIFYDYTDPITQCSNWCMFTIEVLSLPVVNCPQDTAVCKDTAPFVLAGGSPAGGVYSGTGVVGGSFNSTVAGLGNHTITYKVTDPITLCTNSCTFKIKVNPLPNVTCPPNLTVCDNTPPFVLAGATPAGGLYSGPGVVGVVFSPSVWLIGVNTITYDYTDPTTGCSNSCSFTITVLASPIVICPPNMVVCENDPSFVLAGATPAGGAYTNAAGNVLTNFNPAAAALWGNPITYSYTSPTTGCTGTCTFNITVIPAPIVACPPNKTICIDNGPVALVGGTPAGGWYVGPGVGAVTFDPVVAGAGTHTLRYNYIDPVTTCLGTCTFTITVNPLPNVICPPNMTICIDDPAFPLGGGTPAGGTYTGPGISLGSFIPAMAGVGNHTINYSYTDPFTTCSNTCTFIISVKPLPNVVCPPDTSVFVNDSLWLLSGGTPLGGVYSNPSGTPLNSFNPALAGVGMHVMKYFYSDTFGCSDSCYFTITVMQQDEGLDFGDAREDTISGIYYQTLLARNGARHIIDPDVFLGDLIDAEADGQPSWNADADDLNAKDDEDGVTFLGLMAVADSAKVKVKASVSGYLNAWIDFGKDGSWADSTDQIFTNQLISGGMNTLKYNVPAGSSPGETYARFRFSTSSGLTFEGAAQDGEVEDYLVKVYPEDWAVITTNQSHSIIVPFNFDPLKSIPSGLSLTPGDFLGAFYQNQNSQSCGGAILWDGIENQLLMAFGDDPFTPEIDGFDQAENFAFKVFKSSTGQTFDVNVDFDQMMPNADGKFYNNGLSAITGISVKPSTQTLEISEGWNGISTYLDPMDDSVVNMFAPLANELVVLYKLNGSMYWPGENLNTLGQWNVYDGHIVKMTMDSSLDVNGLIPDDNTVTIEAGLNLIPVLSSDPCDVEILFSNLPELILVKEVAGMGVYLPGWNINTLGNLMPGSAYFVFTNAEGEISYDSPLLKGNPETENSQAAAISSPWNKVSQSPGSHIVIFNTSSDLFEEGDIIGGFTNEGSCAGLVRVGTDSKPFALSLNAADPFAEKTTGYLSDEEITFRLYREASRETFDLEVEYNPQLNKGQFQSNGLSEVIDLKSIASYTSETEVAELRIYPNPSTGIFNLAGVERAEEIEIVDAYGKHILKQKGTLDQSLDLSAHPAGIYFIKIKSIDGKVNIYKLIMQ